MLSAFRPSLALIRVAAFAVALSISCITRAEPPPPNDPPATQRGEGRAQPIVQLLEDYRQLATELNLNRDQAEHVREAMRTARESLQAMRRDAQTMPPQDRLATLREALDTMNADIATTLNDEQRKMFETRTAEIRERTEGLIRQVRASGGGAGPASRPATGPAAGNDASARMIGMLVERMSKNFDAAAIPAEKREQLISQMKEMLQQAREITTTARANGADPEETRTKIRALMDAGRAKVAEILTPAELSRVREAMKPARQQPRDDVAAGPGPLGGLGGIFSGGEAMGGHGAKSGGTSPPATTNPATRSVDSPGNDASEMGGEKPQSNNSNAKPDAGTAGLAASSKGAGSSSPTTLPISPGGSMPTFSLRKTDGRDIATKSFLGKPAVFVFGSLTAPSFRDRAPALMQLAKKYGSRVHFLIVYTREQHPMNGDEPERNRDDHISLAEHKSSVDRTAAAMAAREQLGITIEMVTDAMDNSLTDQLNGFPNAAAVFDAEGKLVEHQNWVEPFALERSLDRLLARK